MPDRDCLTCQTPFTPTAVEQALAAAALPDLSRATPKRDLMVSECPVAVLFTRADSVYNSLDCDVWDHGRDARGWPGGSPLVAHPPCRTWGRLRTFARAPADEHALALWAVQQVQRWGGVLEHPAHSTLWPAARLPRPGRRDQYGWTLGILQWWFGHRASKPTWLYIVGVPAAALPPLPYHLGEPTHVIQSRSRARPHVSRREREQTPLALAQWLLTVARCAHPEVLHVP